MKKHDIGYMKGPLCLRFDADNLCKRPSFAIFSSILDEGSQTLSHRQGVQYSDNLERPGKK